MGVTPDLVTGVWVGADEYTIHFDGMDFGQGARSALPIFGTFMRSVYDDPKISLSQEPFEVPEGMSPNLNCNDEPVSVGASTGNAIYEEIF
jgi:penicillin-binding protein 1A